MDFEPNNSVGSASYLGLLSTKLNGGSVNFIIDGSIQSQASNPKSSFNSEIADGPDVVDYYKVNYSDGLKSVSLSVDGTLSTEVMWTEGAYGATTVLVVSPVSNFGFVGETYAIEIKVGHDAYQSEVQSLSLKMLTLSQNMLTKFAVLSNSGTSDPVLLTDINRLIEARNTFSAIYTGSYENRSEALSLRLEDLIASWGGNGSEYFAEVSLLATGLKAMTDIWDQTVVAVKKR